MSSTNRSGASYIQRKEISDYYRTPVDKIVEFLNDFKNHEPDSLNGLILDPCAGGLLTNEEHSMSYPEALKMIGVSENSIHTIDVREDSRAATIGDYLNAKLDFKPKLIITNPPFLYAKEIIEKALNDVEDNGFVIMLLRLNFFEGTARKKFWDKYMAKYSFVHHRRLSFTEDKKTDSVAYAHFVWQKGFKPEFTMTKVI